MSEYGKLNPWVKRKWVTALRSGEYGQGKGALFTTVGLGCVGYCCLGVLASEMVPEFCRTEGRRGVASRDKVSGSTIPTDLAFLWGLDSDAQNDLANKNDSGWSFKRIATWIEKNL